MTKPRIPKSDDVNSFWNYAMSERDVAAYQEKVRKRNSAPPMELLEAAE